MSVEDDAPPGAERRFAAGLTVVLAATALHRAIYVVQQAASDPLLARPAYDAAYYLDWARALVEGRPFVEGAYYLAPLEAWLAAAVLAVGGGTVALVTVQQAMGVATAALLAILARRAAGAAAGLAAATLYALHQPLLFFASRPMAETPAILLLAGALAIGGRPGRPGWGPSAAAGLLLGVAALGRPNLLLVVVGWVALEALRRRPAQAAALALGAVLAILPVTVRNAWASGHLVPVSSNGGLTAYHGNGPGAAGVFTRPAGMSGDVENQRDEATALASRLAGRDLDPVAADGFWARRALATRIADPAGTLRLLARRTLLTIDSAELGLDFHPLTDPVPARLTWRSADGAHDAALLPFGVLLALATAGALLRGPRGSGGAAVWLGLAACAATPLLFYVSSRYRLPTAALLCVPAACGLVALAAPGRAGRRLAAGALALGVALLSWLVPSGDLAAHMRGGAYAAAARARLAAGDLAGADTDARRAVELAPASAPAWLQRGVVEQALGRPVEAADAYRQALRLDPGLAEAAANLAAVLLPLRRHDEAIAALRAALAARPADEACWYNLVVHLIASGDTAGARRAAAAAADRGVRLDPGLLALIDPTPGEGSDPR